MTTATTTTVFRPLPPSILLLPLFFCLYPTRPSPSPSSSSSYWLMVDDSQSILLLLLVLFYFFSSPDSKLSQLLSKQIRFELCVSVLCVRACVRACVLYTHSLTHGPHSQHFAYYIRLDPSLEGNVTSVTVRLNVLLLLSLLPSLTLLLRLKNRKTFGQSLLHRNRSSFLSFFSGGLVKASSLVVVIAHHAL